MVYAIFTSKEKPFSLHRVGKAHVAGGGELVAYKLVCGCFQGQIRMLGKSDSETWNPTRKLRKQISEFVFQSF